MSFEVCAAEGNSCWSELKEQCRPDQETRTKFFLLFQIVLAIGATPTAFLGGAIYSKGDQIMGVVLFVSSMVMVVFLMMNPFITCCDSKKQLQNTLEKI